MQMGTNSVRFVLGLAPINGISIEGKGVELTLVVVDFFHAGRGWVV